MIETQGVRFDYEAEAELFGGIATRQGRRPLGYWRFARAAEAIRFAVEELAPHLLLGSCLEVAGARFDSHAIRRLYDSGDYPLIRPAAT